MSYTVITVLRSLHMAFGMMLTLALYQFLFGGSSGLKVIAVIFFLLFLFGIGGLAIHACHSRLKHGQYGVQQDCLYFVRGTILKAFPWVEISRLCSTKEAKVPDNPIGSLPFIRVHYQDDDATRIDVHQDQAYVKRFGWLSARYRQSRWWFFGCCEVLSFTLLVRFDPFEGQRHSALAVWMLGLSKIVTTKRNRNRPQLHGLSTVMRFVSTLQVYSTLATRPADLGHHNTYKVVNRSGA